MLAEIPIPRVLVSFVRIACLFCLVFSLSLPTWAQEGAPSAPAPDDAGAGAEQLIEILENDSARAALIEQLRRGAADQTVTAVEQGPSIARQLAEYTRSVAEGTSAAGQAFGEIANEVVAAFNGSMTADYAALRGVVMGLAIAAIGLFGSFLLLRLAANAILARLAARLQNRSMLRRLAATPLVLVVEVATVILAWALGYAIALYGFGYAPSGQMEINQSLLLNAFLIVELSKLCARLLLAPRHPNLRVLPISDANAVYWSFWFARIASLLGYTFLFIAPLLAGTVAPATAAAVQVLVVATTLVIAIVIVLQNRDHVRGRLAEMAGNRPDDSMLRILAALGQQWHVLAIAYLLVLAVAWFANPVVALPFMLGATFNSVIAIVLGTLMVGFIRRFVGVGLRLPDDVRARLPLLETRLLAFVPRVMMVVRWAVMVGVILAILQAWQVFDLFAWIRTEDGLAFAGSIVSAIVIVLVAIALHVIVASWVEYQLNPNFGKTPTSREKTLLNLFRNAFTVALVIFGVMLTLAQLGVNIAPLLAGAGVVGLAIGFGAQKLVQDIITGIFIQFENIMNEGDVVAVGDKSGVVEKLTIRSVTIRDLSGTVHLIPFSSVDQVSNMVRGFSYHVAEIGVAYDSDIEEVKLAMRDAFEVLQQSEHGAQIIDDLDMQGIIAFAASSITVRARIKTLPGAHWAIGRKYSEVLKGIFTERGIEIPYPHVTYVQGGEARGSGRVLRQKDDTGQVPRPEAQNGENAP